MKGKRKRGKRNREEEAKVSNSGFPETAGKRRWGGRDAGGTSLHTLNGANIQQILTRHYNKMKKESKGELAAEGAGRGGPACLSRGACSPRERGSARGLPHLRPSRHLSTSADGPGPCCPGDQDSARLLPPWPCGVRVHRRLPPSVLVPVRRAVLVWIRGGMTLSRKMATCQ